MLALLGTHATDVQLVELFVAICQVYRWLYAAAPGRIEQI